MEKWWERQDGISYWGRGGYYQDGYKRRWFHGTYLKCHEEGNRAFGCNYSENRVWGSRTNALVQGECVSPPNGPKKVKFWC